MKKKRQVAQHGQFGGGRTPPWPLGVVGPPPKSTMGVARGGSTTPIWPGGGFGHPKPTSLGVVECYMHKCQRQSR